MCLRHLGQRVALVDADLHSAALHHCEQVLGHLLWLSGRTKEALRPARLAIRLAPGNAFYRAALFRYRWRYAALPAFAGWRLLRWTAHRLPRVLPERRRSLAGRRPLERFTI